MGFYLFFFSNIGHKEERFMLPIWSFNLIVIGDFLYQKIKFNDQLWWFYAFVIKVWAVYELINQY